MQILNSSFVPCLLLLLSIFNSISHCEQATVFNVNNFSSKSTNCLILVRIKGILVIYLQLFVLSLSVFSAIIIMLFPAYYSLFQLICVTFD